jgi:hypothetical protein
LFIAVPVLVLAGFLPQAVSGTTLQSAYTSAGPLNGYDKYVELSGAKLHGRLDSRPAMHCIRDGPIDLGAHDTWAAALALDIHHCVLVTAGIAADRAGRSRFVASSSSVTNSTIHGNVASAFICVARRVSQNNRSDVQAAHLRAGLRADRQLQRRLEQFDTAYAIATM